MTGELPTKVVGCLLDVSRSMRKTLETGQADNHAIERLEAVLSAALKFAQSEQQRGTNSLVFVGLFGLNRTAGYPPVVDLCGVVEALLISDNADAHRSGHDLLIELTNEKNLPHIEKYIRTKLSDPEALIVHAYLRRHPERTDEFVSAIPAQEHIQTSRTFAKAAGGFAGAAVGVSALSLGPVGLAAFGIGGAMAGSRAVEAAEDHVVDNSEALRLAREIFGRMDLDAYIDDKHIRTKRRPFDQGERKTCYAHAIAAVVHMALLRIVGREGGCPSIQEIRQWILRDDNFPETPNGWSVMDVLEVIPERYRPLRVREVDEEGARQAVLHRRPVLATFQLSKDGWETFGQHFGTAETCASVLAYSKMAQHRNSPPDESGHAVVLTGCDPVSLTFLNSWGRDWGNSGSFSIEKAAVLELDGQTKTLMEFYDVYWLESDLKDIEREAYNAKVDEKLHSHSSQFPSIFELETRCPLCLAIAPIAKFSGNMREATCPTCSKSFHPEPGHLVQALYARAGLND
ncbi:hypothetical protein FALBO_6748 [Fusarium albosuccineum]|uniref:Peptidase C1A papain C-terminal domain-containing protein n=1 Tax=Fusarium albosuccineum TaxID=1237068 RepID=A0A8H4LDM8_9HYPO|nr:hypothetical protein FALBO_6748 [Fusarium albosuccineum]